MAANFADDLVLFTDTPAQTDSLLRCLEQTARDIVLNVNQDKTDF